MRRRSLLVGQFTLLVLILVAFPDIIVFVFVFVLPYISPPPRHFPCISFREWVFLGRLAIKVVGLWDLERRPNLNVAMDAIAPKMDFTLETVGKICTKNK